MDKELLNIIVSRVLADPELQKLLGQEKSAVSSRNQALILLNYTRDLPDLVSKIKSRYEQEYVISILASDSAAQALNQAGIATISLCDAADMGRWKKIIIPTCSTNTLAKIALGISDTSICDIASRALKNGVPMEISTEHLHFTDQTPLTYRKLFDGYLAALKSWGVAIAGALPTAAKAFSQDCTPLKNTQNESEKQEVCWGKKLLGQNDASVIPPYSTVKIEKGTVISPLALDTLNSRNIKIIRSGEV